ncbi:MAG TPA: hypothetical protein VG323_16100 [Thermoanaerobaculia bacterium]|nr:hypothetical protein [Thermoanaerobaculia bacterium]
MLSPGGTDIVQVAENQARAYDRNRVDRQIKWLADLGMTLRGVGGRKQVVLLSEGFDATLVQGRDLHDQEGRQRDLEAIIAGDVAHVDSDNIFGNATQLTNVARLERAFRGSDVILSAIDIRGVRGMSELAGTMAKSNDGLFLLSRPTGGVVIHNSNELADSFRRFLRPQEVVYVLGFYAPSAAKANLFHPLQVTVTGMESRVTVSHRSGYYDAGGADFNERLLSTSEIVMNDVPQKDVPISTLAAAFPAGGGRAVVPVIVDIDAAALLASAKDGRAYAEVFLYAFGDDGGVRDRLFQPLTFDLKKVGDRLRANGIRYYGTLSLPPGRYTIKTLVHTRDEHNGFAVAPLVVPKDGQAAVLTPIPIDEAPKAVLVKAPRTDTETYPFTVGTQKYVPCTTRNGRVALYIVGAQPEEITVEGATVLGKTSSGGATTVVLQVDKPTEVTIKRNGEVLQTASIR